ncbi:MAG: DUF1631 family protein [Rhodoferax sp.]
MREQLIPTNGRTGREQQVAGLVRTLMAQTLAYVAKHEDQTLTRVRDRLMVLLDARPPLGQGQNLRSIHLLLGRYGDRFNRTFQKTLAEELSRELSAALPGASRAAPEAASGQGGLSLIDVDEVERVLLLDRVAQQFAARYEAVLEPLTQRLGVLLGRESSSVQDNPFQPLVVLRAFVDAWDRCELDAQATEDLVRSLESTSWLDLAPLYEALNATLQKAGVPAQRALIIKRSTSAFAPLDGASTPSRPAPLGAEEPPRSAWGALAPAGRSVAAHARQFLQRLGLGAKGDSAWTPEDGEGGAHTRSAFGVADPALMGYLGNLQAGAGAASPKPWDAGQDPAEQNVLRQMRDRDEVRRAPELDRGTVDALAEVFDFVFADQAIPMQMKVIIGRLQIPVLKAAMIDRDFFLSDEHPARRLVDTLAGASVAWAPEKGEADPLYVRIESTVQRVLTEFEDNLTLFADLLREFTEFLFESEQQAQARVEPVAQQEHRGESWDDALAQVDELIHGRIQALSVDQPLVPFLLPFLTTQWRQVLALALVDAHPQMPNYAQALATMERLIWSTQPKTTSEQRRELVAVLPEMVHQLNAGLDAIEWNGKPRATFTRRLITTHTLAIRLTQAPALDSGLGELEAREGQAALQQLDERRAARQFALEDTFDAQAQSFTRGLWFDVTLDDGVHVRSRLSWISPMRTRLLFTNREGFDAFVRSEREVAAMLRLGRLRVLDQEPIVARALDQIMAAQEQLAA